jgi:hypothetical protein
MTDPEPATISQGARMRRALLCKVPALEHDTKSMLAELDLDREHDLQGAVELDADAFLTPLAATQRQDRR